MVLDTGILAGMTALTKISFPGLVGSQVINLIRDKFVLVPKLEFGHQKNFFRRTDFTPAL